MERPEPVLLVSCLLAPEEQASNSFETTSLCTGWRLSAAADRYLPTLGFEMLERNLAQGNAANPCAEFLSWASLFLLTFHQILDIEV